MKTNLFNVFLICFLFISYHSPAQTLFTYGTHAVSKQEFLQAYNKNPDTTGDRQQKLKDYLNLYINFRLKLQAAYDEKANTNADLKNEQDNFKTQLTDNFINQQADVSNLLHEAFERSQKDILVQQVFVAFTNANDTASALSQVSKAYSALRSGKSFEDVTTEFSTDESTKQSKGMIGYITAFTLPYSIENIIYALPQGSYSSIYKGNTGYHIFKNVSERPALGRRKVQQLLFPTPAFFTSDQINQTKQIADSVYNLLKQGTTFESQLPVYGKNYQAYEAAASMEIKIGEYGDAFENEVFKLKSSGDFSKPFKTEYGYNIIKLTESMPVSKAENDVVNTAYLQNEIQKDGRLEASKKNLVQKWLVETRFKEMPYSKQYLWNYTDSALKNEDSLKLTYKGLKPSTVLFRFEKQDFTVADWIAGLKNKNTLSNSSSNNNYVKLMRDFINSACTDYYSQHIEDFDSEIKDQLKEFNDANMLFYVMDKHVWSKASQDSNGLKEYYNQHANNYKWNKSISAIVVSGPDKAAINEAAEKIKATPANWRKIVAAYVNSIYSDSGRFEMGQLPVKQPVEMQKDFQTAPEVNDAGDAFTFIHVMDVFPQVSLRNYEDAKGLVINDYQEELEKLWIDQLKKEYPVKINDVIFNNLK